MKAPVIELRDLSFSYGAGEKAIFEGFDFGLERGERLGLLGPNGAGKTTLFHLILGLLRPTWGEVLCFGAPRRGERDFEEVRKRIGLLFQDTDDQLFCPTVEEDVAFGPFNLGLGREEVRERVRETLGLLGLEGYEEKITHHLSGGEKRLVALATIAAMKPECLILDEPTAGLDGAATARVLGYLRSNVETCILASHDRAFLRDAADRVVLLRDGELESVKL